jgi:hypothetical protein
MFDEQILQLAESKGFSAVLAAIPMDRVRSENATKA